MPRSCRDGRLAFDRPDRAKSDESRDPGRILVVDDDPMLRQMVVNYLNENNMRAVSAAGRQEMARHFAESEPNLVILDLRLGEEDGLDLLREIRSHSDVPVIIATGQRSGERSDRGPRARCGQLHRKAIQSQRIVCTHPRRIAATGNGASCTRL